MEEEEKIVFTSHDPKLAVPITSFSQLEAVIFDAGNDNNVDY